MSALEADQFHLCRPVSGEYDHVPLMFFFGQLYMNFKPLQEVVNRAIISYASYLDEDKFWELWISHLRFSSLPSNLPKSGDLLDINFSSTILKDYHRSLFEHPGFKGMNIQIDLNQYRQNLWTAMQSFSRLCEKHKEETVSLIVHFIEYEFLPQDYMIAPSQNVTFMGAREHRKPQNDTDDKNVGDDDEEGEEETCLSNTAKGSVSILCSQLNLFAKFQSPKCINRAADLEKHLTHLLSYPNSSVQLAALESLMVFSYPYLQPYADNMKNIINDGTFRSELIKLVIDEDAKSTEGAKVVLQEHRAMFMPLLVKVLYGKMCMTNIRAKESEVKEVILRYLAGLSASELQVFLNLVYEVFENRLDGTTLDVVERVQKSFDPRSVVPLKKMNETLVTTETVMKILGNTLGPKRETLLKVILFIHGCTYELKCDISVARKYHNAIKHMNLKSVKLLFTFFDTITNYPYLEEDIEAVFLCAVWPNVSQLELAGPLNQVTTLMKLFALWAEQPHCHSLLVKCKGDSSDVYPFKSMIQIISHPSSSISSLSFVTKFLEYLVPDEEGPSLGIQCEQRITVKNSLPVEQLVKDRFQDIDEVTYQNYGLCIMLLHLNEILQSLKKIVTLFPKTDGISVQFIRILTILAKYIQNPEASKDFLNLLVPLLESRVIKGAEKTCAFLDLATHFLKSSSETEIYFQSFLKMVLFAKNPHVKASLCSALSAISATNPQYDRLACWARDLNAYSRNQLDAIDFKTRLDCYEAISSYLLSASDLDLSYCNFIIYSSANVINGRADASLVDSATHTLLNLTHTLSRLGEKDPNPVRLVLDKYLLPSVKKGIKSSVQDTRNQYIVILKSAIVNCHKYHACLKDLIKLTHEGGSDFFGDMMHIQPSRRARGLGLLHRKLTEEHASFSGQTVKEFLLPVASVCLLQDEFSNREENLINNSISCLGALAKRVAWSEYKYLLNHYIKAITSTTCLKTSVKALCAVIDAFHEDTEVCLLQPLMDTAEVEEKDNTFTSVDSKQEPHLSKSQAEVDSDTVVVPEETAQDKDKPRKVYRHLFARVIPQLKDMFLEGSENDYRIKMNKSNNVGEREIRKIPLALAIVKLVKKLHGVEVYEHVGGVLLRLVCFLKSKDKKIRSEAKRMFVYAMKELGGEFLEKAVKDLMDLLNKGFHIRTLVSVLSLLMSEMKSCLEPEHVKGCIGELVNLCTQHFIASASKDVECADSVTAKTAAEVTDKKAYSIMGVLAEVISVNYITMLLEPLKHILQNTQKFRVTEKISKCFGKICSGLYGNTGIDVRQKSVFVYGLLCGKINELIVQDEEKPKPRSDAVDSLVLPPVPKRAKCKVPKTSLKYTSHILHEFGIRLLRKLLEGRSYNTAKASIELLDPFLKILPKYLMSDHPEVSIQSLYCISTLIRYELPSLQEALKTIVAELFLILNKFSTSNIAKGKVNQLVQLSFTVISYIIENVATFSLEEEQLKVLLCYARDNLEDLEQHQSLFSVIRAVISRKIMAPDLDKLMDLVKEMALISQNPVMLDQARLVAHNYMLRYPRTQLQHEQFMFYFLGNLGYERLQCRMSACHMINMMIGKYPSQVLSKEIEYNVWFKAMQHLIKEDCTEQRLLLRKCLRVLYTRSNRKQRLLEMCNKLFIDVPTKGKSENALVIHMVGECLLAFLEAKNVNHPPFLKDFGPKIVGMLHPGRYHSVDIDGKEVLAEEHLVAVDKCLITLIDLFTKLQDVLGTDPEYTVYVNSDVWKHFQEHLLYANLEVRLKTAVLFGKLFTLYPVEGQDVAPMLQESDSCFRLALDFCEQLKTESSLRPDLVDELCTNAVRNLLYLVKHSVKVPLRSNEYLMKYGEDGEAHVVEGASGSVMKSAVGNDHVAIAALFLLRKLGAVAYTEFKKTTERTVHKREAFLKLIAGLIATMGSNFFQNKDIVSFVMTHITRELQDSKLPQQLKACTEEVSVMIKEKLGGQAYNEMYMNAISKHSARKIERKAREKELVVANPVAAARKKIKRNLRKRVAKKRKIKFLKENTIRKRRRISR